MIKCIVIGNFRGTCATVEMLTGYILTCWNAEGVHAHLSECWMEHGKRKVGNPCSRIFSSWYKHLEI